MATIRLCSGRPATSSPPVIPSPPLAAVAGRTFPRCTSPFASRVARATRPSGAARKAERAISQPRSFPMQQRPIFRNTAQGLALGLALAAGAAHAQSDAPTAPANGPAVRAQLPLDELRTFAEVLDRIKSAYVEPVDDKTLLENAIRGMLSNLDPHSAYLDPQAFQELQESTSGEFGGLGIEVGMEDGFIRVVSPIDDTPASRAGI